MTESTLVEQSNMVGGGEVMEVMMTGGDGSAMNEDTLAQVVNMLQMEGQLTGSNHTIIIRQPGSDEIQMIQTTSNGGELVVTKASAEDIQALQAGTVDQEMIEPQQGQVVMMDETGNLVEGVVQMPETEGQTTEGTSVQIDNSNLQSTDSANGSLVKSETTQNEILDRFVSMPSVESLTSNLQPPDPPPSKAAAPITISTTTNSKKTIVSPPSNRVVSIKINTGVERRKAPQPQLYDESEIIKISTVTGRQKSQPPKFHKCESCTINFVSKVAYLNHMEVCPSKKKSVPQSNKGNITYTCVFCETKFTSRLILMQHVRTCDKAKATKSQSISKPKATTAESKLKVVGSSSKTVKAISPTKKLKKNAIETKSKHDKIKKVSLFEPEDEEQVDGDLDSEFDDEKDIIYDDDEDLNDDYLLDDEENLDENVVNKRSQKHLGPVVVKGMFQCRDCNRTFSKEHQYNRHVKACTLAPLNTSRIVNDLGHTQNTASAEETEQATVTLKRKRGRPFKLQEGDMESPRKKKMANTKIVSVDPKKVMSSSILARQFGKKKKKLLALSDSEEESDYISSSSLFQNDEDSGDEKKRKPSLKSKAAQKASMSKIVKISPSDTLIKKTGKAILSKMNQHKSKMLKENPICGLCGDKFKAVSELALHIQLLHSEDLLHTRDLLDGKGILTSVKCPLCDFHFVSSQMLLFHLVSYHSKDLKSVSEELETLNLNLMCPFCNITCSSQELFKEHIATKHLDKLTNKPPPSSSIPVSIDINTIIKDKNNGSIVSTAKLLSKQEKVLCPDCGLFLLKSYFEYHRCAAESYSPSARKFICSELQCAGMTFYKLIHLLTHLIQVHDKSLPCQAHNFDSLSQFMDWLKKEETKTKMNYTKALQRMKQGKLTTVWICHRFHSSMRDPSSISNKEDMKKVNRLNQCYSRIHTETGFNPSTSRYDGKTTIKYYPDHKHVDPQPPPSPIKENVQPPKKEVSLPTLSSEKTTFSDAAELKQLLEDDGDSNQVDDISEPAEKEETQQSEKDRGDSSEKEINDPHEEEVKEKPIDDEKDEAMEMEESVETREFEKVQEDPVETEESLKEQEKTDETEEFEKGLDESNVPEEVSENTESSKEESATVVEETTEETSKDNSKFPLPDTELPSLLDNMLGDDEGTDDKDKSSVDSTTKTSSEEPQKEDETSLDMLTELPDESLQDAIMPEENSSTSTASNTQHSTESSAASSQKSESSKEVDENESETEGEKNTYVLPADIEEWKKLFELIHSQLESKNLTGDDLVNAKELLTYENKITDIAIEKQVEVFNKLCSLADVQI